MERTLYKLLVVGLTAIALAHAITMTLEIGGIFTQIKQGYSLGSVTYIVSILLLSGRFLVAVVALYWVPKFVKKFFPEVS